MIYEEHVSEAVTALGQYLGCLRDGKEVGWGDECLRDLQDQSRKAMIAATPCPACVALGNLFQHGNHDQ
jgi:hypothetical protein